MMGHLNSFSASGVGNFPKIFQKFKCPGGLPGGGGMLKLRFNWYISRADLLIDISQRQCGLPAVVPSSLLKLVCFESN